MEEWQTIRRLFGVKMVEFWAQIWTVGAWRTSSQQMDPIYLDNNGTTPLADEVQVEVSDAMKNAWGNASSSTAYGTRAKSYMVKARQQTADMINASQSEIIFTSGGTEANHLVLYSFIHWKPLSLQPPGEGDQTKTLIPHIITSNIEHPAIRQPLERMEADGVAQVSYVEVNPETCAVDVDDVMSAIQPNTVLITLMMANNETGAVQPIQEIGHAIKNFNSTSNRQQIYYHTDAAQSIGKIPVDVTELGVDYLTIVGHKFYAPRIGALYVRELGGVNCCPLKPLFLGGGQERGYRAGTENVAMISGLGKACQLVTLNLRLYQNHMQTMRDKLEAVLEQKFSNIHFNAKTEKSTRLPNTCNFSLIGPGLYGRRILDNCQRVVAGVGAACHSSGDVCKGSQVLLASGIPNDIACNAIRLSVGRDTSESDVIQAVDDLYQAFVSILHHND